MTQTDGNLTRAARQRVAVAVFASRESTDRLVSTLSAARAVVSQNDVIDVLVNGNPALAASLARLLVSDLAGKDGARIRVWSIKTGDKANAWNQYLHEIWSGEEMVFFIDGYVSLHGDSIDLLQDAVLGDPRALAGSGVPSNGPSARRVARHMLASGGFHGNFCCMRGDAIAEIRRRGFRMPVGLYRVDSLMGAVLSYGFDPRDKVWDRHRIYVHPLATWSTPAKHWWRYQEWLAYAKRSLRQARGVLENAAVRNHLAVRRLSPEALPATAVELVNEWMQRCPGEASSVIRRNPTVRLVLSTYRQPAAWVESEMRPAMVAFPDVDAAAGH